MNLQTYGVIGGIGLGLIYLPAVVAVGYYFERRRALATGISVCGSGVGTFLLAPLATVLLDEFGWKGANLARLHSSSMFEINILLDALVV